MTTPWLLNGLTLTEYLAAGLAAAATRQGQDDWWWTLFNCSRHVFPAGTERENRIALVYDDGCCLWVEDGEAQRVPLAEGLRRAGALTPANLRIMLRSPERALREAAIMALVELEE